MGKIVNVFCCDSNLIPIVANAIKILNSCQNEFVFHDESDIISLPSLGIGEVYSWKLLEDNLIKYKEKLDLEFMFAVLNHNIEGNWFSRTIHLKKLCFITTVNWQYLSDLPILSFVAYDIVENLTEMLVGEVNPHMETLGCLYDLCINKPDISFKIRTGDICRTCFDFLKNRISEPNLTAIINMLENIRLVALGRSDFKLDKHISLFEIVEKQYPFPIAYCFRSIQSELSFTRKFLKMLDLHEVLIKYVTFAILTAIKVSCPECIDNLNLQTLYRPTIGQWHETFIKLLNMTYKSSLVCLKDWPSSSSGKLKQKAIKSSEILVKLRNDIRGHGFTASDVQYQQLFFDNLDNISMLLEFIFPLSKYLLIKPQEIKLRRGICDFSAKILTGSHPIFPIQQYKTSTQIETDILLYDSECNEYLNLYPWLILEQCSTCHHESIFLYDKVKDKNAILKEYPTNHIRQIEGILEDIKQIIGQR